MSLSTETLRCCHVSNTNNHLKSSEGEQELIERGYNPHFEALRAQTLYDELGYEGLRIAQKEQKNNRESYRREFLEDYPVSRPRRYWQFDGKLYSYPLKHNLTSVESGIHPDERDGMTLEGFRRFQKMITDEDSDTGVFLWYSPAGKGGSRAPFNDISYESGRLYVCFKTSPYESVHFDIKIQEGEDVQFPIVPFLQHVSGRVDDDVFDYLREPIACGSQDEFFERIAGFSPEGSGCDDTQVYVSKRNSTERQTHHYADVFREVHGALEYENMGIDESEEPKDNNFRKHEEVFLEAGRIDRAYQEEIMAHAYEHGLTSVDLYGCSTTNIGLPCSQHDSLYSLHSTLSRFQGRSANIDLRIESPHSVGEKKVCCVCPFCKKEVMATVKNGKIYCEPRDKGGCGKSAPYKEK